MRNRPIKSLVAGMMLLGSMPYIGTQANAGSKAINHTVSLDALLHYPAGTKLAEVFGDYHLTKPPSGNSLIPAQIVPRYNPNVPYDPNNRNTSPLEPPNKEGFSYWNNKSYEGNSAASIWNGPNPNLTNASDKVGYGRAFNIPDKATTTAGNSPALLVNLPTGARPADVAAIVASQIEPALQLQNPTGAANTPPEILASAMLTPAATPISSKRLAPDTQPASRPIDARADNSRLVAAFVNEDERHARANLAMPTPPK